MQRTPADQNDQRSVVAKQIQEQEPSPFDQARTIIQGFRQERVEKQLSGGPGALKEKPVKLKISFSDWSRLNQELNLHQAEDAPRMSYNAATSTLVIECRAPGRLHEHVCTFFHHSLLASVPESMKKDFSLGMNSGYTIGGGKYLGSEKTPDLAVEFKSDGNFSLKWVLEVGFSESYEDLVEDVRLWLEGMPQVSMAVIVKFTEDPDYSCPLSIDTDMDSIMREGFPQDIYDITETMFTLESDNGPVKYRGKTWVGQTSGFLETWKRGSTGKVQRHGPRINILPQREELQLRISDFLPIDSDKDDGLVDFDWDGFRNDLKDELRAEACRRCRFWLGQCKRKNQQGDSDSDYIPPGQAS